ncbi:MAG: EamA family transporter RarD, partial [Acidobacteriota bacterium]
MTPPSTDSARERTRGFLYALAAFTVWGLSPIYWKQIQALEPDRLLAHRIVWSALLLLVWLGWQGRLRGLAGRLGRPRTLATLAASTVFIGINWFVYIWSVANARILEASLGYFINPLVAVLLGMLVLGERLRPLQWLSVALAAIGVILLTARVGHLPWVSLVLAGSFGIYGLLRKTVDATADEGLALETWLLTPLALGWLAFGPA